MLDATPQGEVAAVELLHHPGKPVAAVGEGVGALLAFGLEVGDGAADWVGVVGCSDPVDMGLLPVLLMVPVGVGWRLGEPPLVPPSNRLVPVAGRPRSRSDSGLPVASSTTVTVARMPTNSKTVTATSIRVRP